MLKEFKEFALKGNMVDMAVGIILGAAFGKIVSSLVKNILMPPIGMAMGGVDFSQLFYNLSDTPYETLALAQEAGAPTINYGMFINGVLDFVIVALVLFLIIRQMNRLKKEAPAPAPNTKNCPQCLTAVPIKATRCAACTASL